MKLTKKLTNILILVGVILGGIGIDQLTKILVSKNMALYESISIIPKTLNITYIQNRGAAFGMLANHRWVFMIISTVAIIGICVYLFRFCNESMFFKIGLALIISGGIGNMIDRVFLGYVEIWLRLHLLKRFLTGHLPYSMWQTALFVLAQVLWFSVF